MQITVTHLNVYVLTTPTSFIHPKYCHILDEIHAYGCDDDAISLACSSGYFVNVTNAYYGMSPMGCTDECCAPNADDCKELVSELFIDFIN